MNAALPTAMKLTSETKIIINTDNQFDKNDLSDKEYLIIEAVEIQGSISISDIQKILDQKTVMPLIKAMIQKGYIFLEEEIQEKYKAKTKKFIFLNEEYQDSLMMKALFEALEKKPKQLDVLQQYLILQKSQERISAKYLLNLGLSSSAINTLVKNEIFRIEEIEVSRLEKQEAPDQLTMQLSEEQNSALAEIESAFENQQPVLLYGITSSGKTMLYIELIKKQLNEGKQVLILVPEIGLTTQLISRYRQHFESEIGIYHSRYNENQRAEVWQNVRNQKAKIILGTRSSIFLPFENLGLIIVDEEHD